MGQMVYNVLNNATQVLASKQIKDNIFVELIHRNGKGVNEVSETNASTVRMFKTKALTESARELGATNNGGWFDNGTIGTAEVSEYDLNLLYVFNKPIDIPEVQQDMVAVNLFDTTTKNIGGRIATEINASTLAHQIVAKMEQEKGAYASGRTAWTDVAVVLGATPDYYQAILDASSMLDNGDEDNGIQAFPFDEREIIVRPAYRKALMSAKGVLIGGSNYAQSMIAKGSVSPEDSKEFGSMYVGEIDLIPVYLCPDPIWNRAGLWVTTQTTTSGTQGAVTDGTASTFNSVQALVVSASATDRGISTQDYVKVIDSPNGAGKRLQPNCRWGVNVCYAKGIVPILANGTASTKTASTTFVDYKVRAYGSK